MVRKKKQIKLKEPVRLREKKLKAVIGASIWTFTATESVSMST